MQASDFSVLKWIRPYSGSVRSVLWHDGGIDVRPIHALVYCYRTVYILEPIIFLKSAHQLNKVVSIPECPILLKKIMEIIHRVGTTSRTDPTWQIQ